MEKRTTQADRRSQTVRSLVYGSFNPRRLANRRPDDDQNYIVDLHDQSLFMLAMAIIVMSCMDGLFTLNLLSMGAEEVNYFMKVLIEEDARQFLTIKYLATASGVVFLVAYSRFRLGGILRVRRILEIVCALYACLIIWELYLFIGIAYNLLG